MAAYAALVSLMNVLVEIQNHPRLRSCLDKKQFESLGEKVGFLLDFIESGGSKVLESQIASAAYAAEDVIESHVVDQIGAGSISLLDLQTVIQDMDSLKEKVANFEEERGSPDLQPTYQSHAPTSLKPLTSNGESKMVGFDGELIQLMDFLTGVQSNLQIFPIVGMGGIGKTTLARNIYENPLILEYFHICAWATTSQEYGVGEIFAKLLSCQSESTSENNGETEYELGIRLYESLVGKRYLIILDDIWSIEIWDRIKFCFPNDNNGSRVVITTRLSDMPNHFGSSYLSMKFLDEYKSWDLFCEKAFPLQVCPPELEEIGKKIAKKCNGLPLLIVAIGTLLRKSSMTHEYWEYILKDIYSNLNSGVGEHLDILSFSYRCLPPHLKPCFLYTGIFPEDHEINVSQLIKLWVAEGFIKPNKTQSLEEVAEGYLKDLIDRNLVLVGRLGLNGKIKTCRIFHLLRHLCLKIAHKEKFLCVMRGWNIPRGIDEERRIVFHVETSEENNDHFHASASLARSLVCNGDWPSFKFRLLRVLNVANSDFHANSHEGILDDVFMQVNLRYICTHFSSGFDSISRNLPSSISVPWNLQTLIIKDRVTIVAPPEIWKMRQLRHLEFDEVCLPDPPLSDQQDDEFVLQNLQTLERVLKFRLSEEVYKRIPNIKKLQLIYYDSLELLSHYHVDNLGRLHKLESLSCCFYESRYSSNLLQNLTLPISLRKLTLERCCLNWEDLTMIGSLPNLEVLKLLWCSARGREWDPLEGEFLRLKFLGIYFCDDLIHWQADSSHFPVLENLDLEGLSKLDQIPPEIGDIPTLVNIRLVDCSESAAISAMKIQEEQESYGNVSLQVRVRFRGKRQLLRFKKKMKQFESATGYTTGFLLIR